MITIYLLQLNKDQIRRVQEATKTTKEWVSRPTHGLFGSPEWWDHIHEGTLPVHHLKGIITRVYSTIGWPEFAMRAEDGKDYTWSRYANDPRLRQSVYRWSTNRDRLRRFSGYAHIPLGSSLNRR